MVTKTVWEILGMTPQEIEVAQKFEQYAVELIKVLAERFAPTMQEE